MILALVLLASGFVDVAREADGEGARVEAATSLDARGGALWNLDLDRGLDPSGRPLFAVPASRTGQLLGAGDLRVLADLAAVSEGGSYAVRARLEMLHVLTPGWRPEPADRDPVARVSRLWGEAVLPFGALTAGRTGSHWGLGMLANAGDCDDCRHGDSADRLAFVTPIAGHYWIVSGDLATTSPFDRDAPRSGFARTHDAQGATFAILRWKSDETRDRRRGAGRPTLEYGALVSHQWSNASVKSERFRATAGDAWMRVTLPHARFELEAALLDAVAERPTPMPGVTMTDPVLSRQAGLAFQSEAGGPRFRAGLDGGVASGDPAPGFGAFPGDEPAAPGEIDGAQSGPGDARVDAFRFHPDYHVDRILFREIVGTVVDAAYLRPHAEVTFARGATFSIAAIASRALHASSTPGGAAPLGVEIDPTLAWENESFRLALEHAVLFPLAGLDNPAERLDAKPAQSVRLHLRWSFR